jgi:hypothetical protein
MDLRIHKNIKSLACGPVFFRDKRQKNETLLPYLTLGRLARFLDLTPDIVYLLVKKGCLSAQRNSEGKMVFKRNDVIRWMRETGID